MKYLIIMCAILCSVFDGSAFVATPVRTISNSRFGGYLRQGSGEAYTYWASYEIQGADVKYTVYEYDLGDEEENFGIIGEFTLRNVVSDHTYPTYIGTKPTEYSDIIVTSGVFTDGYDEATDRKVYCVFVYDSDDNSHLVYTDLGEMIGKLPTNDIGEVGYFIMSATTEGPVSYVTIDEVDTGFDEDGDKYTYTFWSFNDNSGINDVNITSSRVKAYPNPISNGQTLTVELPRISDSNTTIVVTDMNGRQEVKKTINSGRDEIRISSNSLNQGLNIYTLIYSDGESFSGKLIKD